MPTVLVAKQIEGRFYFAWKSEDSDEWHAILTDLKQRIPHADDRQFHSSDKCWSVPLWHRETLHRWADAWFEPKCQKWTDQNEHRTPDDPHYQGDEGSWRKEQKGQQEQLRPRTLSDAYNTLHLLPTAPPEVAVAAHRAMVRLAHPDAGGSHTYAVNVNLAWEILTNHFEKLDRRAS